MNEIMRSLHSLYLNVCGHRCVMLYADEPGAAWCMCCYELNSIGYYYSRIDTVIRELARSSVVLVGVIRRLVYRSIFRQHRLTSQGHDAHYFLVPQEFEYLLGNQTENKDERDNEVIE